MEITKLDIDGLRFPVGIDDENPVFHYQTELTEDAPEEFLISGHRIRVTEGRKRIWDSGVQPFDGRGEITYAGPALAPKTRYDVWASVYNEAGEEIEIDRPVPFETGFLGTAWQAKWVTPKQVQPEDGSNHTCWQFYKAFAIEKDIRRARIYASAIGMYEIACNHQEVSSLRMAPFMEVEDCMSARSDKKSSTWSEAVGGTAGLCYQTYPATGIVRKGDNNLTVTICKVREEEMPSLLLQIEIDYRDGSRECIISDESFAVRESYISGKTGECWDMEVKNGQDRYRSEEKYPWGPCEITEGPEELYAPVSDGVRITEEVPAKGLLETPKKQNVIDFGETLTGGVRIALRGEKGQIACFYYSEALDAEGNFPVQSEAVSKDELICTDGYQVFEPRFTCRRFRYICVNGVSDVQLAAAEGLRF